ncbi:hypothetical protein FZ103_19185 [Streptomonospora sp. PA3]|uniref:hypothetical protein n=1 Tax=Streptomonospora sp. PA3 TaxID=2607326 RepID=UPI0012DE8A64|nr:hypothetical protein [Streptomonospora sp. PA3]MUL43264.1 hypothetical protein [Streptomonospora sp. PA3]
MVRRIRGSADVGPYDGSPDQQEAKRKWAEREEAHRRFVAKALEIAEFASLGVDRHSPSPIRRLAELSAETMADPQTIAELLNDEGSFREEPWNTITVMSCIEQLWPHSGYFAWPKEFGTYPGYLGGLRDRMGGGEVASNALRIGPGRSQQRCIRCESRWPPGWPGTERESTYPGEPATGCPDCGCPWTSSGLVRGADAREHSIIDLHWMLYRFAPRKPGPCPVCGAERVLANSGRPDWIIIRQLDWACSAADPWASPDPLVPAGRRAAEMEHYRAALEPAEWESEAAHYAYWMAVDVLRVAAANGEEAELPLGAVYEALDGSGQRWVYGSGGWRPVPTEHDDG